MIYNLLGTWVPLCVSFHFWLVVQPPPEHSVKGDRYGQRLRRLETTNQMINCSTEFIPFFCGQINH